MTENKTDRMQQLEDVMNELQSLRTGTNVKSMIVVQSEDATSATATTPTANPHRRERWLFGLLSLAVVGFVGMSLFMHKRATSGSGAATRLDQLKVAAMQASTGDADQVLQQIEVLTDADCSAAELITAAVAFTRASVRPTDDRALAEHRAARAVLFLRRAVVQGLNDANELKNNRELAPLHERTDFKRLVGEMNRP